MASDHIALDNNSASLFASSSSSSVWDRITTWAAENKTIVYTIAGTAIVVTAAGVLYYSSETRRDSTSVSRGKKKSKKERRNEKKKADGEKNKAGVDLEDQRGGMYRPEDNSVEA